MDGEVSAPQTKPVSVDAEQRECAPGLLHARGADPNRDLTMWWPPLWLYQQQQCGPTEHSPWVLPTAGHQAEQGLGIRETNVLILAYYVGDIGKLLHSFEFQLLHLQNGNKNIYIRECNKEWTRQFSKSYFPKLVTVKQMLLS